MDLIYSKMEAIINKDTSKSCYKVLVEQTRLSKIKRARQLINDGKASVFHQALVLKMKVKLVS